MAACANLVSFRANRIDNTECHHHKRTPSGEKRRALVVDMRSAVVVMGSGEKDVIALSVQRG